MRRLFSGVLAAALVTSPLSAHDFWIEPSSFRPAVGSTVAVRLFVGPHFTGEPFPRVPLLVSKFVLVSASGEQPIPGGPGDEPAGTIRLAEPGLAIVGYRSLDYPVSLDAAKFEDYLKEEGLEKISTARSKRGETEKPAREVFSRCAKALLDVGGAGTAGFDRPSASRSSFSRRRTRTRSGPATRCRCACSSTESRFPEPSSMRCFTARPRRPPRRGPAATGARPSDCRRPGFWMIKSVEMGPAPAGVDADWQSLWASLTFEMAAANPVGRAP